MLIARRDALLVPTDRRGNKHLHLVVCAPFIEGGFEMVVWVSIASYQSSRVCDETCLLYPDDHPFIKHKSYVYYTLAEAKPVSVVQRNLQNGLYVRKEQFSEAVFQKIYEGFKPPGTKNFVLEYLGLPTLKRH